MSGIITQIIPKQRFDFTWLGNAATKTLVLHSALNVVPYYYARLAVRLHATSSTGLVGDQEITLAAYGTDPSPDDPAEFTKSASTLSVTLNVGSGSPPLLLSAADSDLDPFLKIALTFEQDATGGTAFWAELSADLVLREG